MAVDGGTAERLLQLATFGPTAAEFAAVKVKGVVHELSEVPVLSSAATTMFCIGMMKTMKMKRASLKRVPRRTAV